MLTLFKKIFGKSEPKPVIAPVAAVPQPTATPMPSIEVAHLSLAAITARFPEELRSLLNHEPEATATVALPLPTILKQLPTGSVKMSLASLQRQAHGLIKPLAPGDKRMVEVPLAEIFRHVRPGALKRRLDQRAPAIPENGFNLFGDGMNPYAISPDDHLQEVSTPSAISLSAAAQAPRVLRMDPAPNHAPAPEAPAIPANWKPEIPVTPQRVVAAPSFAAPKPSGVSAPAAAPAPVVDATPIGKPEGPTLPLKITALAGAWPAEIRTEIATFDPETVVTLPVDAISAGLAKGRVNFTWGHIRSWLEPEPTEPTAISPAIALQLPLKIVAPAFLSASKQPKVERKTIEVDGEIPALFDGGQAAVAPPKPAAPEAVEPPAPEPELEPEAPASEVSEPAAPEAAHEPEVSAPEVPVEEAPVEETPVAEAPVTETPVEEVQAHVEPPPAEEPTALAVEAEGPTEPVSEEIPETVIAIAPAAQPGVPKLPETVGEIFHTPHKRDWTPAEIVAGTVKLPGVAGAIVALQEGLQVSSILPDGVKSEVVAAFLPQIFARLNQYAGEMRLGDVDDLLFTTHGAHCQIYRLGYVYFAILGTPGESLPWHELRLISEELARQTHK